MGVAALLIILCHAPQYGVDIQGVSRKLLVFGNIGVDVFLFLSGMGCWFSLTKSPNYFPWLKRRSFRIFIPYTIVLLILRILSLWVDHVPWDEWLLYFSTLRFWTHHDGMWYVALLVLLYPLAPLLYRACELSRNRTVIAFTLIILILIITHIPVEKTGELTNSVILNLQGAFKRTVSFVFGMYIAPYVKQGYKLNALYIIGASALSCVLFHLLMKEVFYAWLYVLPLLIVFCYILERIPEKSIINVFLFWIGAASLESYLTNVGIRALMPLYISPWSGNPLFGGHYLDYALVIVLGLIMSYLTHVMSNLVTNKI